MLVVTVIFTTFIERDINRFIIIIIQSSVSEDWPTIAHQLKKISDFYKKNDAKHVYLVITRQVTG